MSDAPSFLEVAISWLPMLLMIGVFIWFSRRITGMPGKMKYSDYMEQQIAETKRHNAILEEILHQLKSDREGISNIPTSQ